MNEKQWNTEEWELMTLCYAINQIPCPLSDHPRVIHLPREAYDRILAKIRPTWRWLHGKSITSHPEHIYFRGIVFVKTRENDGAPIRDNQRL